MVRSRFWSRLTTLLLMAAATLTLTVSRQGGAVVQAGVLEQLPAGTAATTHVLSYQGRLADPTTGAPKADGSYSMTFRIYDAASAGAVLWTEIKDITVSKGLFSTLLGDTTALNPDIFDGNDRWLGVKVLSDAEATPRMRLAFVPYATWAWEAGSLDGEEGAFYRNASNINAGTLADARIAGTITRDGEVMGIVTGADGVGSGLDADLLDGLNSDNFASAIHTHKGVDIVDGTIGTVDLEDGAVTSSKIADGSVATADLANGAVTAEKIASNVLHHFISIDPAGINMDTADGVSFVTGFGPNAGVRLPDANTPSIDFGFIIPPDYSAGSALTLRIIWHTASTNCGIVLAPNYVAVARAGRSHLIGGSVSTGISGIGGNTLTASSVSNQSEAKEYSLTSPDNSTTLQTGDSFIVGLYRSASNASDTCTGDLKIQGIQILY